MTTIEKTYDRAGDSYQFKFKFNESIALLDNNFDIVSFDGMSFGYETQDELTFYPSITQVTLDNFFVSNYEKLKKLVSSYSKVFPFNFTTTFTIEILKNGTQLFSGLVDNYNYDFETQIISLEIADASHKYKTYAIDNYDYLNFLDRYGFPGRSEVPYFGGLGNTGCKIWGYPNAEIHIVDGKNRLYIGQPQEWDVLLKVLLELSLKSVDINTNVSFAYYDWLFGNGSEFVDFSRVYGRSIFTRAIGFLLQKRKDFVIEKLSEPDEGVPFVGAGVFHKYAFKKVYDDGEYETWQYINTETPLGLDKRKLTDLLKFFQRNFFAEAGFTSYNKAYFRKKADYDLSSAVDLTPNIKPGSFYKEAFRQAKKYVEVRDRFRSYQGAYYEYSGQWGEQDAEEDKLVFDIWFSGHPDIGSSNLMFIDDDGHRQSIYYAKDPVTGVTKPMTSMIVNSEFNWNGFAKDRYSMDLHGVDYNYTQLYKVIDEDGLYTFLKPVTLDIMESEGISHLEAINLQQR